MFERLLLAIDESSAGEVGVSFAIALARRNSAAVHVLYVNQYVLGGRGHTQLDPGEAARTDCLIGVIRLLPPRVIRGA